MKSTFFSIFVAIFLGSAVYAKVLEFNLQDGPGVQLVDVDVEEKGAVYDGDKRGPRIEIGKGEKLFRVIVTADVHVYPQEFEIRKAYYQRFQNLGSGSGPNGVYHIFQIRDVVRIPISVENGGVVDFTIHFDPEVPGLTFSVDGEAPFAIDAMTRLSDNQHFGISPKPFANSDSNSSRSVCLEMRQDPDYPIIMECVRWGSN